MTELSDPGKTATATRVQLGDDFRPVSSSLARKWSLHYDDGAFSGAI